MRTLVDFDSNVYAIASACDGSKWNYKGRSWELKKVAEAALEAEGKDTSKLYQTKDPEPWDKVERTICKYCDDVMMKIEDPFNTTLLVGGGGNFRESVASILEYKGNRVQEKPFHFNAIKDYIIEHYGAKKVYGIEVDDAVGILNDGSSLIISQDKDLLQLPGNHKHPSTDKEQVVSFIQGLSSFYSQVITGDTSDNILGLYGIGAGSTYVKAIKVMDNEADMYELVAKLYQQRFGTYYEHFLRENMLLLWLVRNPNEPTPLWQEKLLVGKWKNFYKPILSKGFYE